MSVELARLFAPHWTVTRALEVTADGVTPLKERERTRLRWKQQRAAPAAGAGASEAAAAAAGSGAAAAGAGPGAAGARGELSVTLSPMEIRTWQIAVEG